MRFDQQDIAKEKHPRWKGEEAGYVAKHNFARKYYKGKECETCHATTKLHIANISGNYIRTRDDWKTLCATCHYAFDNHSQVIRERYPLGVSGIRGVRPSKYGWHSSICINRTIISLGHFKDKETATMIRIAAEEQLL